MVQPDFPKLPPGYNKSDDKFWKPIERPNESKEVKDKNVENMAEKNVAYVADKFSPGGSTATTSRCATDNSSLTMKASKVLNNPLIPKQVQHQSQCSVKNGIAHIKGLITCPIAHSGIIKELTVCNFGSWYYQEKGSHDKVGRNCAFTASRIVVDAFLHCALTVRKVRCKRSNMLSAERTFPSSMKYLIDYGFMVVENNRSRPNDDCLRKVDDACILATEEKPTPTPVRLMDQMTRKATLIDACLDSAPTKDTMISLADWVETSPRNVNIKLIQLKQQYDVSNANHHEY
jgi:hypothetical protein